MIEYAKEKAGDLLHLFGYVDVDENLLTNDRKFFNRAPLFKMNSKPE